MLALLRQDRVAAVAAAVIDSDDAVRPAAQGVANAIEQGLQTGGFVVHRQHHDNRTHWTTDSTRKAGKMPALPREHVHRDILRTATAAVMAALYRRYRRPSQPGGRQKKAEVLAHGLPCHGLPLAVPARHGYNPGP